MARIKNPLISIILPTYNREQLLPLAVKSVLQQSWRDFELIIVDDGSKDNTPNFLLGLKDSRITYIHTTNRGEYAATNNGLRLARGSLITFMHSDDLMPPHSLKIRVQTLQQNIKADFCQGAVRLIDAAGKKITELDSVDWSARQTFREYLRPLRERQIHYMVHYPTIMLRKELLARVGYLDEALPWAGDLEWMLRVLKTGRMVKAPGVLYSIRIHDKQRSKKDLKKTNTSAVSREIFQRFLPDGADNQKRI